MKRFERSGWRRYYCPVCGHVEWLAPGHELAHDYRCPLCRVRKSAMLEMGTLNHCSKFERVSDGVWRSYKLPLFPRLYQHFSYLLKHPEGLVLYDAPPVCDQAAVDYIQSLGTPKMLIISHADFVGCADEWAAHFGIPVYMGVDVPLPGELSRCGCCSH